MESLATNVGAKAIGVILTGMGDDGASGLLRISKSRGLTIAQDEETSVVYGMPKAAVRLGAVQQQLALNDIVRAIAQHILSGPLKKVA